MAYSKHTWNTKEPITKAKMQNIEDGIAAIDTQQSTNTSNISTLQSQVGNINVNSGGSVANRLSGLDGRITVLEGTNTSALNTRLTAVEGQVEAARQIMPSPSNDSLAQNLQNLKTAIEGVDTAYKAADTALSGRIDTAQSTADTAIGAINAAKGTSDTLAQKINSIENTNTTQSTAIGNIQDRLNTPISGDDKNVEQHLSALHTEVNNLTDEIETARGVDNLNVARANLNARFVDDETRIGATESRLTSLETATSTTIPNRISNVEGRATALESEVNAAHNSTANDETYASLDARFEAVESKANAAAVASTVNDSLTSLDTRLDAIDGGTALTGDTLVTRVSTVESDLNTASTGLKAKVGALETTINDASTGLAATKAIADAAATASDLTALAGRVTTLENNPQSTTTIVDVVTYNNDGIPTNISNPSTDIDYLLKKDDKYYYWKYINNTWHLISGREEGGGTSSAEFYSSLTNVPEPYSETVDYFIGSNTNYIHYRYLNNQWVTILPAGIINDVSVDTSAVSEEQDSATKSRPIIKRLGSDTNLLSNFMAIQSIGYTQDDNGTTLTWVDIDGSTDGVTITGGGGSATAATASITRVTDSNLTTISGENCQISYKFVAKDSNNDLVATAGTATWYINRAQVATSSAVVNNPENENAYNTFDITPYLQNGVNNITLSIRIEIDNETITRTKTWVVDVKNFSLVWEYDSSSVQDSETIDFTCVPYGTDITKTLHLKIDNTEVETQTITTSGIPITISTDNIFSHGSHTAQLYMTATINEQSKQTTPISHDFIVVAAGNNNPIIAATLPNNEMDQYNTMTIPFVVYTPNSNTSTVVLKVDGVVVDTRENVSRATQRWNYTPLTSGAKVLTITSGTTIKTLNLTVNSININNEEIGDYVFKLKASELPSNNALKDWYYDELHPTTSKLQFSNNFDWINGGIQTEYDDNEQLRQFIRVKSGTRMTIPYEMFATDPRVNGSNFKIIFKIENCRDYDAKVLDCMSENIGIQLNAHNAIFKSTTTPISTQYGEEEYTELEFEVYKATDNNNNAVTNQYMMAWIDGVITTARKYGGNFVQSSGNTSQIVIGSDDCDICIYLVKYYAKALGRNDHITNFIADAPNAVEMISRYNRNNILDEDGDINHLQLAQQNPDCRVWLYDIDRMTTGKKDAVNVNTFQQIWQNGDQYYQLTGTNAKLTVQGTSSVNYRKGAANTDINFGVEGATLVDGNGNNLLSDSLPAKGFKINDDSLPITYSNTKVNFASCEQVNNMCNAEWYQRYQPYPSNSARDCMEFAMGVQFIKDRGIDEPTDPNTNIQEVQLFNEKPNRSSEKFYMYSIANMGNSKKNTNIFHGTNECCIEIKENTSDAQKMKSFDSAWTESNDNTQNYEMRYPDVKNTKVPANMRDGWARFVQWMVANNPNAATNEALAESVTFAPYTFHGHNRTVTNVDGRNFEQVLRGTTVSQYAGTYDHDTFEYRMAKMLSECEDYMAMDSVIYHFCFIERHTMVDNVAKNTFWSSDLTNQYINGEEQEDTPGYWIWDLSKNYDNDTADGNNNNGLLVFDYGNEANDTYNEGVPVFNGHDAVWFVFASNLYEACQTMFVNREAKGAWNSSTYRQYLLSEQRKVPERVWNECYWYDYLRTYENNIETAWIAFLDGGQKTHQRAHYETYQEIYEASKYRSPFSHGQSITLRGEAIDYQTLGLPAQESKFTITMFNKCYLTIWIGTNFQTVKCQKGVPVTLHFYEDNDETKGYMSLANSVIDIDSGSMVQTIGDLSRLYPSSGQFGSAKRLRSLQIGSSTSGYYNPNMNTNSILTFNNKMLEELYVQNLPQATYNLDLSNCPELRILNAAGSGFTGFVFANGGLLNEAYINNPTSLIMRNLDYLTNANFHLTTPAAVTLLRLEGCKLFDNYTFVNSLTNLNTLRITNINWTLSGHTLLDRLVSLMGIDESGYTVSQSYLAGAVTLTGTVYEGKYNNYISAWSPDLTIDYSNATFIQQHLVTYKDENNNILYSQYINHGDYLIDPYYNNLLVSAPTKAADIQYQYIFGQLDYADNYIPFSGWKISSDSQSIYDTYQSQASYQPVNSAMTIIAVFTTTPQRYTVRWLLREGATPIKVTETPQNYGGGYNLTSPTIKEIHAAEQSTYSFSSSGDLCTYSILSGWEKLPTNITPTELNSTYDIYATWLTRTDVDYNTVLSSNDYSVEEKLFVLKNMSAARANLHVADKYPIKLGYDGIKTPTATLIAEPIRYTGTATTINAYTPFSANKSFTMAIDYRFEYKTSSVASEAVLLSCYEDDNNSVQGFKLFYDPSSANPVPEISFGSTAQQSSSNIQVIGPSINNRGMVVIRHIAGDPLLYIYTGTNNSGLVDTFASNTFRKTIQWSANISNAKIVLGGINLNDASIMNATGVLYSVKYWEEDLGEGECLQLANWCHETINFAVSDYRENEIHSAINTTLTSSLVLHALNASEMGTITEPQLDFTERPPIGWDPSTVRTFYNNRIYQALPTLLQSIIIPPPIIPHRKAYWDGDGGYVIANSGTSTTRDYVFAPSCVEVGIGSGTHGVEATGSFAWCNSSQMKVMAYSNGSFSQAAGNVDYTNLRFPYRMNELNQTVTIYTNYPSTGSSFYQWAINNSIVLRSGDILIPAGENQSAYIYVTAADVNKGAPIITNNSGLSYLSNTSGGWIESTGWWTRSVPDGFSNRQTAKLMYLTNLGSITTNGGTTKTQGIVYSIAL